MIPGIPVVTLLLVVQAINGVLLPIELFFIMLLINDKTIMGKYTNHPLLNILAWVGVVGDHPRRRGHVRHAVSGGGRIGVGVLF